MRTRAHVPTPARTAPPRRDWLAEALADRRMAVPPQGSVKPAGPDARTATRGVL